MSYINKKSFERGKISRIGSAEHGFLVKRPCNPIERQEALEYIQSVIEQLAALSVALDNNFLAYLLNVAGEEVHLAMRPPGPQLLDV